MLVVMVVVVVVVMLKPPTPVNICLLVFSLLFVCLLLLHTACQFNYTSLMPIDDGVGSLFVCILSITLQWMATTTKQIKPTNKGKNEL